MNVSTDILRLSDAASLVPGLSAAFKLAILIIQTVQISKRNTARLQYLSHLVADSLVSIAENMQGKWDIASPGLKIQLDEFEAILHNVLKVVKRHMSSSSVMALINAGDREFDITMLEKRLSNSRSSIILFLGFDTSLALQHINQTVNSTYSAVMESRFERLNCHCNSTTAPSLDDPDIRTYTREDIEFLQQISQYDIYLCSHTNLAWCTVTVKLHRAERNDKRIILVKTYHDVRSTRKRDAFERDLTLHRHTLDPSTLQLVGASRPTASIPFQVFHMPGGHIEPLKTWLERTLYSNPVEAITGIYDMRTSVRALVESQQSRTISLPWNSLRDGLYVTVQPNRYRQQRKLIYAGELSSEDKGIDRYDICDSMSRSLPWGRSTDRATTWMGEMLCRSLAWMQRTDDLVDVLGCPYAEINLSMLGAAMFERGLLAPRYLSIHLTGTIALGDVGYETDDGKFVVIENVHQDLQAAYGSLSWKERLWVRSGYQYFEDTAAEVVGQVGNSYQRRRLRPLGVPAHVYMWNDLLYQNLDRKHAWGLLRHDAHSIVARHCLSISPHELMIVTGWWRTDLTVIDGPRDPGEACTFGWGSNTDVEMINPSVYLFSNDDIPNIRNSGARELTMILRTSFDSEPHWLDDATWYRRKTWEAGYTSASEVKDGLYLRSKQYDPEIVCLQLPIGAARPFITEVEE